MSKTEQPLLEISETTALAAGYSARMLGERLKPLAAKCETKLLYWIIGDDACEYYCLECARKKAPRDAERGAEGFVDGGWGADEADGPEFCEGCGEMLDVTYTEYGAESELEHFLDDLDGDAIRYPGDAVSMLEVLSWHEHRPEWAGRLALLCYRQMHPRPWWWRLRRRLRWWFRQIQWRLTKEATP